MMAETEQSNTGDLQLPSEKTGITRGQWITLIAAFLGWMFDGFEMGLFPLIARPALRNLLETSNDQLVGAWFGIMIAGFLVGAATGGVLFGWLGDRIGRVRAMTLSVLTYALFSGLCGIAGSVEQIFTYRFVASLGMGGEWSLGVALVMEIWPNRSRGLLAGLIGAASNVGFLLIAIIGLGLGKLIEPVGQGLLAIGLPDKWVTELVANSGWRLMMLFGALPALLTFLIRLFVPESERWLEGHGKGATQHWATRDLLGVLVGACGALFIIYLWMDQTSPLVAMLGPKLGVAAQILGTVLGLVIVLLGYTYPVYRYLQRSAHTTLDPAHATRATLSRMLIGACLSGVALLGTWGSLQNATNWADKIEDARGATVAERSSARSYTQICSAVGAIVGTMAGALLGNAIGRRITYTLLCLGSLVSSLVFFKLNVSFGPMFLVSVFVAGGLTASFYGWLPLYLPELFRTTVRATGQGFSFNFGRVLAAVGALQFGNLLGVFKGSYPDACSVLSLIYIVGVIVIWFAPETHGKPLPD